MRHLCEVASIEVLLLSRGVIRSPDCRLLVPPARGPDLLAARRFRTRPAAISVSVVTLEADEEHLAAPGADHKAQRELVRVGPIFYSAGGGAIYVSSEE